MCLVVFETQDALSHLPSAKQICEDWREARMKAYETLPFDEIGRVIQEIDNRFNDFLDYVVYYEGKPEDRAAP